MSRLTLLKQRGRRVRKAETTNGHQKDGSLESKRGSNGRGTPEIELPSDYQLTPQQAAFVMWLSMPGMSATQAAINAGYSETSAHSQASELRRKPNVAAAIRDLAEAQFENHGVSMDLIFSELAVMGFAQLDSSKLKPADKLRALELLAKFGFDMGLQENTSVRIEVAFVDDTVNFVDTDDVEWEAVDDV